MIGPDLAAQLEALHGRPLRTETLVQVSTAGSATVLRAGAQPEAGDTNRRALPLAYVRADEMIRPIRAAEGLDFCDSWSESTTSDWLRRFERRLA